MLLAWVHRDHRAPQLGSLAPIPSKFLGSFAALSPVSPVRFVPKPEAESVVEGNVQASLRASRSEGPGVARPANSHRMAGFPLERCGSGASGLAA
jgi:hypothetical protein